MSRTPVCWRTCMLCLMTIVLVILLTVGSGHQKIALGEDLHQAAMAGIQNPPQLGSDGRVPLIIQFQEEPVLAHRTRSSLQQPPADESARELEENRNRLAQMQQQFLDSMTVAGVDLVVSWQYTDLFNGLACTAGPQDVERIASQPQVRAVFADQEVQAALSESVPLIGAPTLWQMTDMYGRPVMGEAVKVAILDTGIDYTHPDLGGCFGVACKVSVGYDFVNNDPDPMDDNGHGTHVAGIAAADGQLQGVAPKATLYAYKVLDQSGRGADSTTMAALERAVDPDGNPATDDGADVINLSLGGPGGPDEPLALTADAAARGGVVVVAAAGNSGPGLESVQSPAIARTVLAVAATDKDDQIAGFSARGPMSSLLTALKPDLVAPGAAINSVFLSGGYGSLSGTSMAAPHVAGAAALLRQLHPAWPAEWIKASLTNSAYDLGVSNLQQGAGRVDLAQAAAVAAVVTPGTLGFGPVETAQPSWTQTRSLQIFSVSAAAIEYTLGTNATLPGWMSVAVEPSSVLLSPGGSAMITVKVTVTDTAAAASAIYYYPQGRVVVQQQDSGASALTIPFALQQVFVPPPLYDVTFSGQLGGVVTAVVARRALRLFCVRADVRCG